MTPVQTADSIKGSGTEKAPRTGDENSIWSILFYTGLLCIAGTGIIIFGFVRRGARGKDMITVFNRENVYVGIDMLTCAEVRETLAQNKIDYTYKVRNRLGSWSSGGGSVRGRTGSMGMSSDRMYEYEVYVHKKDYEKARYILRDVIVRRI